MEDTEIVRNGDNHVEQSQRTEEDQDRGCSYQWCDPRGRYHRFIALLFMCFMGFGSYFCYDTPGALQDKIIKDLNITTTQFSLLYSFYSWPNIFLCFVGGFLIDRVFGIVHGSNLYMLITLIGQIIFASGAIFDAFWLTLVGRFIFGIGGESLAVAQNNYAVLWFKGKELNMVFGLQLSFARFGSTVNFWVVDPIYEWINNEYKGYECLGIVLFIAAGTCIFSLICVILLGLMDKRAERLLRRNENGNDEVVQLKDIFTFSLPFWVITIICVTYYITIFPFIALGKNFFIQKFHMKDRAANSVNSIIYLISAVASPIFGFMVDKTGKNILWIVLAIIATGIGHSILAFTLLNPYVGMSIIGLAYSVLASSLWPLVALIIPEHQLGTAYGICQAVQNLGLAVIMIIDGVIVDHIGYFWLEIFNLGSLGVALLSTIVIWVVNSKNGGTLNMTPNQRDVYHKNLQGDDEREKLLEESTSAENQAQ